MPCCSIYEYANPFIFIHFYFQKQILLCVSLSPVSLDFSTPHFEGHSRGTRVELLCGFMMSFTYLFSCCFYWYIFIRQCHPVYHVSVIPPPFPPFFTLLPNPTPVHNAFCLFIAMIIVFLQFPTSSSLEIVPVTKDRFTESPLS